MKKRLKNKRHIRCLEDVFLHSIVILVKEKYLFKKLRLNPELIQRFVENKLMEEKNLVS